MRAGACVAVVLALLGGANAAGLREKALPATMGGAPTTLGSAAGYFALNRTKGPAEMFYLYFAARDDVSKDAPVVLWMTGGPGCAHRRAAGVAAAGGAMSSGQMPHANALTTRSCEVRAAARIWPGSL